MLITSFLFKCAVSQEADLPNIFAGKWTVKIQDVGSDKIDSFNISFKVLPKSTSLVLQVPDHELLVNVYPSYSISISEKGRIHTTFSLEPKLPPHLSAAGIWDDTHSFRFTLISTARMSATVINLDSHQTQTLIISKIEDDFDIPWYDKYYKLLFMIVVGFLSIITSKMVQKCVMSKRKAEALRILEEEERAEKETKHKKSN